MICTTCKRELQALFTSAACDHCDFGPPKARLYRGYVVFREASRPGHVVKEYVFNTRMDADEWQCAAGLENCTIREVYSLFPFRWHLSRGTLRDLVLADHKHEVFADHRYENLPFRCFLGEEATGTESCKQEIPL